MTENQQVETNPKSVVVLRVPKPNLQVIALGLIAIITLFQTLQLVRISSRASSISVNPAPVAASPNNGGSSGTGSNADVPQSMVGGC